MSNKLSSVTYQYRNYKPDQVLTHTQLNETIAYFEDQNRLSRVALTGVGIIHGLTIAKRATETGDQFVVHQGVGITTDGDLTVLHKQLSEEQPKENIISIEELSFTHFRVFSDEKAKYSPYFYEDEEQIPIWEFCNEEDNDALPLAEQENWENMNFLVYLESYPKSEDICGDINCDNQGIEQVSKLRFLMLENERIQGLVNQDEILSKSLGIQQLIGELSPIQLMKVVHNGQNTTSLSQIDKLYSAALENGNTLEDLGKGLHLIIEGFGSILEQDEDTINLIEIYNEHVEEIFKNPSEDYNFFQYRYQLAKDLVNTYNELIIAIKKFDYFPNPKITPFPKHLLLGKLDGSGFRHNFYRSPALGSFEKGKKGINSLIKKLIALLRSFEIKVDQGLRIIPNGKRKHNDIFPSIPFYYVNNEVLIQNWGLAAEVISFYYGMGNNPLLLEYDGVDSYLIGGHLGMEGEDTFQAIQSMVSQFGLEFKVYHFDLSVNQNELKKLFKDHPACTSTGGVSKAGTYILLSQENKVFADLSLPYRIVDESGLIGSSHIKVAACSYPWISSLKYLNNLSRSIKGSVRRSGIQPRNYRLVVNSYSINENPLITGAVTLEIPFEEIHKRRMHAITEALNERFPKGLVFDFDESLKRLVITRPYDDEFKISFSDNTLSINSPSYTYTQEGMEKSDKTYRIDSIRCEELKKYRESTYVQLQNEFAPIEKDDDYGAYTGKWKLWYELIDDLMTDSRFTGENKPRIPQSIEDLPSSVSRIIARVQRSLEGSQIPHDLYLTGDWVNGSWASIEMINEYKDSTNTNDTIFRFLNLRSSLHKKDQATKASLVVVLDREIDRERMVTTLSPFTELVDVYIEVPAVRNQPRTIDTVIKLKL
ncbi:hypothetical protein [Cyclobacterium marinum]|uniref:hypothetical protein n=1 Tax=Cyclobacterium marinum TaxID=104 RepID=UPI0030DDBD00|tara:strand:+ start:231239 stop:233875 length:2637 start_codon:yes stop_codon:yes gene_type:complete